MPIKSLQLWVAPQDSSCINEGSEVGVVVKTGVIVISSFGWLVIPTTIPFHTILKPTPANSQCQLNAAFTLSSGQEFPYDNATGETVMSWPACKDTTPFWVPYQQAVGRMSCQSKLIAGYTSLILLGTCSRFATRATYVQINIIINKVCSLARVLRLRKTLALVLRRLIGLINRTQLASRIAFGGYWQRNENRKRIRNRNNALLTPLVVLPIHYAIISNDFRKWYFLWLSCRQGNAFIKANGNPFRPNGVYAWSAEMDGCRD